MTTAIEFDFEMFRDVCKEISPNSRSHWAVKRKAVRETREAARLVTLVALNDRLGYEATDQGVNGFKVSPAYLPVKIVFQRVLAHPRAQMMDGDNLQTTFKPIRDGVCLALGIDDDAASLDAEYQQEWAEPSEACNRNYLKIFVSWELKQDA